MPRTKSVPEPEPTLPLLPTESGLPPLVAIIGRPNVGKSTLFNALTGAGTYAADQLFATLDTLTRRLRLADGSEIVLSDTVGFVRDLPHQLVEAFRATLEETVRFIGL